MLFSGTAQLPFASNRNISQIEIRPRPNSLQIHAHLNSGLAVCRFPSLGIISTPGSGSCWGWRSLRSPGSRTWQRPRIMAAPLAVAAGGGGGGSDKPLILFMIESLGWIFGPLLMAVSVALVALVVLLALDLRMSSAIPPGFVDEFTDTVNKRKFKEAFDMARNDPSFLGSGAHRGDEPPPIWPGRRPRSRDEHAGEHQERQGPEEQLHRGHRHARADVRAGRHGLRHDPVVQSAGDRRRRCNPAKLADGISHALVVTLFGVAISVPAIFFNAFFRNRITRVYNGRRATSPTTC